METGDVIKKLRNKKRYTQSELGVMLGVNLSSIQKYESGVTKNLKLETIRELCHIFEVPPIAFVFPEIYLPGTGKKFRKFDLFDFLLTEVMELNDQGKNKVLDYIEDIYTNPNYRRD